MNEHQKPAYWAVLPATIRYDPDIPSTAKLLYAEISALTDISGYCFASNDYFASNFEITVKSVQRLIKNLADKGYVTVDVVRDPESNEVVSRRIFAGINPTAEVDTPHLKNKVRSPQKQGDPSPQKCGVEQYNNIINNNPLYPPKGNGVRKGKHPPRKAPDWKPERFDGLWNFYPPKGRKNKQNAMDVWDRLQPSDELIDKIAVALVKQKATDDWKRGIGIPHVSTYLNNSRWEDAESIDVIETNPPEDDSGWAPDPEVI